MVAQYPLQSLLSVRHFREENAKNAVRSAERALREAEELVQKEQEVLNQYREWLPQEEDRRYNAFLGIITNLKGIDDFKAGLSALKAREVVYEEAVMRAEKNRSDKEAILNKSRIAARTAQKETAKIATHKDIWIVEYKKEVERQAELELEDFKPMLIAGEEGEEL